MLGNIMSLFEKISAVTRLERQRIGLDTITAALDCLVDSPFQFLPLEISTFILCFLDIKTLALCRQVCKFFNYLLSPDSPYSNPIWKNIFLRDCESALSLTSRVYVSNIISEGLANYFSISKTISLLPTPGTTCTIFNGWTAQNQLDSVNVLSIGYFPAPIQVSVPHQNQLLQVPLENIMPACQMTPDMMVVGKKMVIRWQNSNWWTGILTRVSDPHHWDVHFDDNTDENAKGITEFREYWDLPRLQKWREQVIHGKVKIKGTEVFCGIDNHPIGPWNIGTIESEYLYLPSEWKIFVRYVNGTTEWIPTARIQGRVYLRLPDWRRSEATLEDEISSTSKHHKTKRRAFIPNPLERSAHQFFIPAERDPELRAVVLRFHKVYRRWAEKKDHKIIQHRNETPPETELVVQFGDYRRRFKVKEGQDAELKKILGIDREEDSNAPSIEWFLSLTSERTSSPVECTEFAEDIAARKLVEKQTRQINAPIQVLQPLRTIPTPHLPHSVIELVREEQIYEASECEESYENREYDLGERVLAKWAPNGYWYRGSVITEISDKKKLYVIAYDDGSSATLSAADLATIENKRI